MHSVQKENGSASRQYEKDSFMAVAQSWLNATTPMVKESTYVKYCNLLESYIYPCIGDVAISTLSHELIQTNCNQLLQIGGAHQQGLSPKTVADIVSVIRCVLRFAQESKIELTCKSSPIRIRQHVTEMRVLSQREQETLCRYLFENRNPYDLGILICLFCGLRVGEICALQWKDVSLTDQTIHVHQTMQRIQDKTGDGGKTKIVITAPKSACSIRTIPIPGNLVPLLAAWRGSDSAYLLSLGNRPFAEPRSMQNHFKKALEKCNIAPANFHSLRHTFATRCVELGFDPKTLSEILGHANVNITMNRYVHPSMELKREQMQRLSLLLPA